jgi:hypothetical protein
VHMTMRKRLGRVASNPWYFAGIIACFVAVVSVFLRAQASVPSSKDGVSLLLEKGLSTNQNDRILQVPVETQQFDLLSLEDGVVDLLRMPLTLPQNFWGLKETWYGSGETGGEFYLPYGVTRTPDGRIVVADTHNHRMQLFEENGSFICSFGEYGSDPGQFIYPYDAAVTSDGKIYVMEKTTAFSCHYNFVKKIAYIVCVSNSWFENNWKSMRDIVNGITVFLVCHGGDGGQEGSPVGNAGGRVMLGYKGSITDGRSQMDMLVYFARINGSFENGNKRTAGKAFDGGNGYNTNLVMYGKDWTTLGPSPALVGKTLLQSGKGSATIIFDTFMDSSSPANDAVTITSGSGSARRWLEIFAHKFGISCDFTSTIPSMRADADNCINENVNVGRKLSGDRLTYGQDKTW